MARTVIPVSAASAAGSALNWVVGDTANNMLVPGWNPSNRLIIQNLDGAAAHAYTIPMGPAGCPTCGVSTPLTKSVPLSEVDQQGALSTQIYAQADGSLWINPSSAQLRFAVVAGG